MFYDVHIFFDRKIHTIDMLLLLFLLDPIQKFCLKIAKTKNCQNCKLLELKDAKLDSDFSTFFY